MSTLAVVVIAAIATVIVFIIGVTVTVNALETMYKD